MNTTTDKLPGRGLDRAAPGPFGQILTRDQLT
jgi:hypothetical protein